VNSFYKATGGTDTITGMPDYSVMEVRKENMVDHTWKFGKGNSKGHGVISKDGKTMTYTLQGTDAEGKKTKSTSILEKQ
jgi:hypothetical protein